MAKTTKTTLLEQHSPIGELIMSPDTKQLTSTKLYSATVEGAGWLRAKQLSSKRIWNQARDPELKFWLA
jgi:hypothetical protein